MLPCDRMTDRGYVTAGKIPAIAALAYHRASGRNAAPPNQSLSYSENFLYMLDASNKVNYKYASSPFPSHAWATNVHHQ